MAFGEIQAFTWTGNPSSPVPATLTVTDTYGSAIVDQLAGQLIQLEKEANDTANIGLLLLELTKEVRALTGIVQNLTTAVRAQPLMMAQFEAMVAMQAANQIKTNNFFKALDKNEEPVLPSIKEQLKTEVKDSATLLETADVAGGIQLQMNTMVQGAQTWISSLLLPFTQPFNDWVEKVQFDYFPSTLSNPQDVARKEALKQGLPPPPIPS
jgi:hypothetical protein